MKGVEYPVQLNECTSRFASSINKSSEICKITSFVFECMCCIRVHSYNHTFIHLSSVFFLALSLFHYRDLQCKLMSQVT